MNETMKQYVIVFRAGKVRDAQVWINGSSDPDPYDDEHWIDAPEAEVLAGVYPGETEVDAIAAAAAAENCSPDCLRAVGAMQQ